jgi:periplasmic divalent cation tolerance protein
VQSCVQLTTAVARVGDARRIARAAVESRLAACVQLGGPVTSTYRWQGRVETAREWLVTARTTRRRLAALMKLVKQLHPYQTPEIIATPIVAGSRDYLVWVAQSVRPARRGK